MSHTEHEDLEDDIRDEEGIPVGVHVDKQNVDIKNNKAPTQTHVDNSVNKALPWAVLIALIAAFALGLSVSNSLRTNDQRAYYGEQVGAAKQQTELLKYYVMELDGKLLQRGLIKPEESFAGQQVEKAKAQERKP